MEQSYIIRNGRIIGKTVPNINTNYNYSTCPIGSIFAFGSERIPFGFFICDGASYKVADYPDLYAVIGNTYGGDSTNFNVPNLVDKFIQGSTTSGTEKEAGLPNIEGKLVSLNAGTSNFKDTKFVNGVFSTQTKWNAINGSGNMDSYGEVSFDASLSNPIYGASDTVQPPALTMVYIIKAFHTNEGTDSNEVTDQIVEYVANKIAEVESKINPTINVSGVFSNGTLDISTLCSTYGNGRYVIVGQGTAGNGSATIDIWTLASHAISYIVNVTYSNKTTNTFIGLTYENPTINFEASYLSACNHIAKVCTLV